MLLDNIDNSIVQIITDEFKGMGYAKSFIKKGFVILSPHTDKQLKEEFGESVTHAVIVPITQIKLIIILKNGDKETT